MSTSPLLSLPNFTTEFTVETDACGEGVGAVLVQEGRPIAYLSKALSDKHKLLSVYEKEMLAIVMAIQKWRPYLLGRHFKIKTNHHSFNFFYRRELQLPVNING